MKNTNPSMFTYDDGILRRLHTHPLVIDGIDQGIVIYYPFAG